MMTLTLETIRTTENDERLLDLLFEEARRLLPDELFTDADSYYGFLDNIPRGIRALAGVYPFIVSMQMDDLAWHFSNHSDERHIRETLYGLRELEMIEIADLFEKASIIMQPYLVDLRPGRFLDQPFYEWAEAKGIRNQIAPWNDLIWAEQSLVPTGLLAFSVRYARKYPERCIAPETQS